jgi:predicted RND superfamily exporter protein
MSVDYIIHIAHAYHHSMLTSRRERTHSALLLRGSAVVSAAVTTIGSNFILLFCEVQLFPAFGRIVILTTSFR